MNKPPKTIGVRIDTLFIIGIILFFIPIIPAVIVGIDYGKDEGLNECMNENSGQWDRLDPDVKEAIMAGHDESCPYIHTSALPIFRASCPDTTIAGAGALSLPASATP